MFGKLLKYDMKSMLKTMIPLWIALIVTGGIMTGQFYLSSNTYQVYRIGLIGMGSNLIIIVFVALLVAILVVNILIIVQRFWNGLLKDEGYLMFTLPVSARKLILSKAVSALFISLGSMLACIICGILIGLINLAMLEAEGLGELMWALSESLRDMGIYSNILFGVFLCIIILIAGIYHVYAAMAIGHLSNRNRFLCTFGAYIVLDIILSLAESPVDNILLAQAPEQVQGLGMMALSVIEILIFHVITELILTYKLNLE